MEQAQATRDLLLITLYAEFSEESYAAGWMSGTEGLRGPFRTWLQEKLTRDLEDYEQEGLPVLRAVWDEVKHLTGGDHDTRAIRKSVRRHGQRELRQSRRTNAGRGETRAAGRAAGRANGRRPEP